MGLGVGWKVVCLGRENGGEQWEKWCRVGVPWIRGVRGLLCGERVIMEGLPRDRENRAAKINQPARNLT